MRLSIVATTPQMQLNDRPGGKLVQQGRAPVGRPRHIDLPPYKLQNARVKRVNRLRRVQENDARDGATHGRRGAALRRHPTLFSEAPFRRYNLLSNRLYNRFVQPV